MKEEENSISKKYEKFEKVANIPNNIQGMFTLIALISNALKDHHHIVANRLIEIFLFSPISSSFVDVLMKIAHKASFYKKIIHNDTEDL